MKTEKWVSRYEDEYGNVFEGHYIEVGSKEILTEIMISIDETSVYCTNESDNTFQYNRNMTTGQLIAQQSEIRELKAALGKVECTYCNGTGFSGSMQFVGIFRRQTCRVCFGSGKL